MIDVLFVNGVYVCTLSDTGISDIIILGLVTYSRRRSVYCDIFNIYMHVMYVLGCGDFLNNGYFVDNNNNCSNNLIHRIASAHGQFSRIRQVAPT